MLINKEEYQAMYEVEDQMWWYRTLHDRVIKEVKTITPDYKNLKILDAGCGTGGLMGKFISEGVKDIQGFDFNEHAVAFSSERGLTVRHDDISIFAANYPANSFDVVVSNDVLYQLDDRQLLDALQSIKNVLKPGGLFITNNNAFDIFGGIHDIAVGSKRRFVKSDFETFVAKAEGLRIKKYTYWSLLLSPLILGVRLWQKLQLRLNMVDVTNVKSDVSMPSSGINSLLYKLTTAERAFLPFSPFGSSLFLVISKV